MWLYLDTKMIISPWPSRTVVLPRIVSLKGIFLVQMRTPLVLRQTWESVLRELLNMGRNVDSPSILPALKPCVATEVIECRAYSRHRQFSPTASNQADGLFISFFMLYRCVVKGRPH